MCGSVKIQEIFCVVFLLEEALDPLGRTLWCKRIFPDQRKTRQTILYQIKFWARASISIAQGNIERSSHRRRRFAPATLVTTVPLLPTSLSPLSRLLSRLLLFLSRVLWLGPRLLGGPPLRRPRLGLWPMPSIVPVPWLRPRLPCGLPLRCPRLGLWRLPVVVSMHHLVRILGWSASPKRSRRFPASAPQASCRMPLRSVDRTRPLSILTRYMPG